MILDSFQPGSYEMSILQNLINEIIIINSGKVLIVAHSQGNFFANEAVLSTRDSLLIHWQTDQKKVRLVSVATPTSSVEGDGSYTTLNSDGIIGAIPTALPPNAANLKPSPGFFDHEFIKHYLNGNTSGAQILLQIEHELKTLSEIGKSEEDLACKAWFSTHVKNIDNKQSCLLECSSFPVDMSTFVCHSQCLNLCKCEIN